MFNDEDDYTFTGIEEAIYAEALTTNYRLENWPQDDLEAYCGLL